MKRTILFIFAVAVLLIAVAGFVRPAPDSQSSGKIKVVSSIYPLSFFAGEVGREKVEITSLVPSGTEPHDYAPSARDISGIEKSRLFLYSGAGLEPWAEKIAANLSRQGVLVLALANGLATGNDPHVWLNPLLAKQQVTAIVGALGQIDPLNIPFYAENGRTLNFRLDALDQSFQQGLAQCRQKDIVASHAAWGYLASRYGFTQLAIAGLSPDTEPSLAQVGILVEFVKAHNIKYVFFEPLLSPRLAETIAREASAQTLVLNPLEGLTQADQLAGKDYFSIQSENLAHLKLALECD